MFVGNSTCERTSRVSGSVPEPLDRNHAKYDEDRQDNGLRGDERQIELSRNRRFEERYSLKDLRDSDNDIQIENESSAQSEDRSPDTREMKFVPRPNRDSCQVNREHGGFLRECEMFKWNEEGGHAGNKRAL